MKIVQIVHNFPPESIGGTETYAQTISRRLMERGHQCHILAGTSQRGEDVGRLDDGVHVTRLTGTGRKTGWWFPAHDAEIEDRVRGYLTDLKPDIVHIQHWVSLTANLIALCGEVGLPTIVTLHDLAVICPRGDRIRFDKVFCTESLSTAPCLICVERQPWQDDREVQEELALRQRMVAEGLHLADRLVVPSQTQKDFLAKYLDIPANRLEVLPHGTLHDLRPVGRCGEANSRKPLRIGHWGHLIWQKGPHLLLEAVRKLSDLHAVELHFMGEVGDPAYQQELHALAQGLIVTFHGAFTPADLTKLDLDVAIFPGLFHESHSFVLDEAFQLGLPVIVSSRGAPAERVGAAGLVFSAGDVGDLATKIEALLTDPALLEQLRRGTPKDPPHPMSEHIIALEKIYRNVTRFKGKKSIAPLNYLDLLILRQRELVARETAIAKEQARYQHLHTQAQEYQGHLERELARGQEYQGHLERELAHHHTQAQEYQGHLERELEKAKAEYQQLHTQAQEHRSHLERELEKAKAEYQQLHTQAQEHRSHLERELAHHHTQAQEYQGHLERELEKAKAEYQQLHTQAQEHRSHLERELIQWQGTDKFVKDQLQMSERFLEFQQEQKQELERVRGELLQLVSLADDRDRWREAAEGLSRHVNELEHQRKWQEIAWGLQGQLDELGQQIKSLSQERDQSKNTLDRLLAHSAIRLYLRARGFLISPSEEV